MPYTTLFISLLKNRSFDQIKIGIYKLSIGLMLTAIKQRQLGQTRCAIRKEDKRDRYVHIS